MSFKIIEFFFSKYYSNNILYLVVKLAYTYLLLLDIIIHYEVFHYLVILQS